MKTTHVVGLFSAMLLAATAAATGCSDDETTTGAGATGPGPTSTTTSTTSTSTSTTSSTTGGGGMGTGGDGMGGMGEGGGSAQAQAFCAAYEQGCEFGANKFADTASCIAAFDAATMPCQTCWTTHLANAGGDPDSVHCSHACGSGQGVPAECSACGDSCQ